MPTPEELFQYDQVVPDAAARIIAMAEREQQHRLMVAERSNAADIEHRAALVESQRENSRGVFRSDVLGQSLGWLATIACVAGSVYSAVNGAHPTVSIALVGLPIATVIKAFLSKGQKNSD